MATLSDKHSLRSADDAALENINQNGQKDGLIININICACLTYTQLQNCMQI